MGRAFRWLVIASLLIAGGFALGAGTTPKRAAADAADATISTTSPRHQARHRHHRRIAVAKPAPTPTPAPPTFVACDANITVRAATTSCGFAENTFYELYAATNGVPKSETVKAWSAAAGRWFWSTCRATYRITCVTPDGGEVRFSTASLLAYTDAQARTFARAQKVWSAPPVEAGGYGADDSTSEGLSSSSGYGGSSYDDSDDYDTDPYESPDYTTGAPTTEDFDSGRGSIVTCEDGTLSHSGGIQGACSQHGGVG